MKTHYIFLTLLALGLTACDCYVKVAGQVLSSSTGKPISDAQITMLGRNRMVKTDAHGKFMIDQVTGFCFNPELEVTKDGFKPFIISLISESDLKSYHVKSDLKHFDFDEKVYPDSLNKKTFIVATTINRYSEDFESRSDSIIIYLDDDNLEVELNAIKKKLQNSR